MVRMKFDDKEFDEKELDVEYTGPDFERYRGELAPTGTILTMRITKMWATTNDDGDQQTKILLVAEDNNGSLKKYNGLPIWETLTWKPNNSRRYQPWLQTFGLTVRDYKRKLDVQPDDDNLGTPINSIAGWEPGSDDAVCRIAVLKDFWNEEWRDKVDWDGWLPADDEDADEDDEDVDDEEEEEAPASSTRRTRASASTKATKPASRRRAEPEPDEDDEDEDVDDYDDDEEDDEEEAPPPSRRRASAPAAKATRSARPSGRASARPAARTSGRATGGASASRSPSKPSRGRATAEAGYDDEPPF